ncbi:MAG: E3 ubiquitin ligase family protein [Bacteroidetes bacterium]|nr:E3 ubiquitin ligase family protein [Bacteroidota bacterium]
MIYIGVILIALAGLLLFLRKRTQDKLLEIRYVKTSSCADVLEMQQSIAAEVGPGGFKQQIELKGAAHCETPLKAELSGEPCVYYSMSVEERYEERYTERDSQGNTQQRTRTGSSVVASNTQATRFQIDDGTGRIDMDSTGAKIDARSVLDKYEPYGGAGGSINIGSFTLNLGGVLGGARRVLGYHYRESIIAPGQQLYVLGEVDDSSGTPLMKRPSEKGKPFILSIKSEEELTHSSERSINLMLYGAVACAVGGIVLILFGL